MSKKYFFQAGSFPDLSFAELVSVFNAFSLKKDIIHRYSENIFLILSNDIEEKILGEIFKRVGGFVRYGVIVNDLDTAIDIYLSKKAKITFGISNLTVNQNYDIKKLGREIKTLFKEYSVSSRFVPPMHFSQELNAAQLIHNKILEKGFELCILGNGKEELYALTFDIQDIQNFAIRDTEKPVTDTEMGVLPPKLARIMINLTGLKFGTIWDPFCGSGTIPMEASLLGFDFLASDKDPNAVHNTEENIKWLDEREYINNTMYETFVLDVTQPNHDVVKKLSNTDISAIVCEPYMGVPQHKELSDEYANKLLTNVKSLLKSLIDLVDNKIEKRGLMVVLVIPSYKVRNGWLSFGVRDILNNRWEVLNSEVSSGRDLKWSRKNSIITRNIFILHRT